MSCILSLKYYFFILFKDVIFLFPKAKTKHKNKKRKVTIKLYLSNFISVKYIVTLYTNSRVKNATINCDIIYIIAMYLFDQLC